MARKPARPGGRAPSPPPDADDDTALWARIAGTVRPLRGRPHPRGAPPPEADGADSDRQRAKAPGPDRAAPRAPGPERSPSLPYLAVGSAPGLDKRTALRLRRGRIAVEGRIDLHGMTREEARARLSAFLCDAAASGRRCVLVITGRGAARLAEGGGVIRAALPRWLNDGDIRPLVLAFAPAQPRDGGAGAFYVYLRRMRGP